MSGLLVLRQVQLTLILCCLGLPAAPVCAQPLGGQLFTNQHSPVATHQSDEAIVKAAGLPTDGPALLEFARIRAGGAPMAEQLRQLIDRLGSDQATVRERAGFELLALGPPAVPALRQAVKDPDAARTAAGAGRCLDALENRSAALTSAIVRLLGQRKPPGSVEAMLGLLPVAEDEQVTEEIQRALASTAFQGGKVDPALMGALDCKVAACRSMAIDLLAQHAQAETEPALRRLLRDPAPSVRFRVAMALAAGGDAEAVGVLISLLADLPLAQGRQADDFLASIAGDYSPKIALAGDELSRRNCRDAWDRWWRNPPTAIAPQALLEEVRKRTLPELDRVKVQKLIEQLGDEKFGARERATAELKALGKLAAPLLSVAARSRDLEVSRRSGSLLQDLDKSDAQPLNPAVCRLLGLRKPAGATEVLLAFLPMIDHDTLAGEVQAALGALATVNGQANDALLRALEDSQPLRRAAAGEAFCQGRCLLALPAVRKLLKDPEAAVRARVAMGLVSLREREAVPVLVALLTELPVDEISPVEDYLHGLAGDRSPAEPNSNRQKRREAWAAWWDAQGSQIELPQRQGLLVRERHLGYTLLVQPQNSQVVELDQAGKVRWQIGNLSSPQDAQALPGDRLLVAEYGASRVTERNLKGEILWQKMLPGSPLGVQRLASGTTLITLRDRLLEVDRSGREILTISRPMGDLMTATRLRDGRLVCVTNQGACVRLDRAGKELGSFRTQGVSSFGNELLPNGHVLIPLMWQNKVTEYNADGKIVWEAQAQQPYAATRLANGNTLVSCQQWPPRMVELDRTGKQVGEVALGGYTVRLRRR